MKLVYLILLFVCAISSVLGQYDDETQKNKISLADILELILIDPIFKALNRREQLKVLEFMYTTIVKHIEQNFAVGPKILKIEHNF